MSKEILTKFLKRIISITECVRERFKISEEKLFMKNKVKEGNKIKDITIKFVETVTIVIILGDCQ